MLSQDTQTKLDVSLVKGDLCRLCSSLLSTQEPSYTCHYIGTNERQEEGGLIIEERCMVVTIHKDV